MMEETGKMFLGNRLIGLPEIKYPKVLFKAAETYGTQAQTDKTIEEMSELTRVLIRERLDTTAEGKMGWRDNIIEEMADVYIMLAQLIILEDAAPEMQTVIDSKTERLAERLGMWQKEGTA